jgi:hypothetical protein
MKKNSSFSMVTLDRQVPEGEIPLIVEAQRRREVPVLSKERIALFAGIETSPHFSAEAAYGAFAGILGKKDE